MDIVIILHLKYLKKKRHINCDINDYTIFGAFFGGAKYAKQTQSFN